MFVATDLLARQAHAIDADWNVLFSYPEPEQDHAGIRDALIEDFNDNGKWQLVVGFWALLGVHGVDQEGKRAWSNRECGSVLPGRQHVNGARCQIGRAGRTKT